MNAHCLPHRAASHARRGLPLLLRLSPGSDTPLTVAVLAVIVMVTVGMRWGGPGDAELREWASTNLVNLHDHPLKAIVSSIVVTTGGLSWTTLLFAVASAVIERRAGIMRAVALPLTGHTIATLVTEGAVRRAIWSHTQARSAAWQLDTGISYVAFTAAACASRYAPPRWRAATLALLGTWVLVPLARHPDMTSWGHVLSVMIGLLSWHWLPGPIPVRTGSLPAGASARTLDLGRTWWVKAASTTAISGLALLGLAWVGDGAVLPPLRHQSATAVIVSNHAPHQARPNPGHRHSTRTERPQG